MDCFAQTLRKKAADDRSGQAKPTRGFAVGLAVPFVASVVVAFLLGLVPPTSWPVSKDLILVDVIELLSIGYLAFHTQAAAEEIPSETDGDNRAPDYHPIWVYKITSIYMFCVGIMLTGHIMLLFVPALQNLPVPLEHVSEWSHSWPVLYAKTILSFLYMFGFWFGNWRFKHKNEGHLGVERFAQAFIYGINIPTVVAFFLGPVDKPVLAPARPERLGRRDTHLATGVTSCSADPTGKQRIKEHRSRFQKES